MTFDQAEAGLAENTAPEILMSSYEQNEDTVPAVGTLCPYEAQIISVK